MLSLITRATLWLLLLLGAYGALCGAEPSAATGGANSPGRIVVLGDSITAGYGLEPTQAYPALLQAKIEAAKLPYVIANAGVSGDTTAGGLRRIDWVLGSGAQVLIIALGGNDGLRGIAPRQTAENLAGIIQKARAKMPGIVVLLAGMRMPDNLGADYVGQFQAIFPQVAAEQKVELIPYLLEGVGGVPELNQADQIHPNVEGQKRVAENVWAHLEKVLPERKLPCHGAANSTFSAPLNPG
jgi:acyl-CoA thioesterase-1